MWDFSRTDFNQLRNALREQDFSYCDDDNDIDVLVHRWVTDFFRIVKDYIMHKPLTV